MVCPPHGDVMTDFTPIGNVNCRALAVRHEVRVLRRLVFRHHWPGGHFQPAQPLHACVALPAGSRSRIGYPFPDASVRRSDRSQSVHRPMPFRSGCFDSSPRRQRLGSSHFPAGRTPTSSSSVANGTPVQSLHDRSPCNAPAPPCGGLTAVEAGAVPEHSMKWMRETSG